MFDIKKEVPSLELCKKLKELGFPQDGGGWYYYRYYYDNEFYIGLKEEIAWEENPEYYYAPTVRELGEWLPEEYEEFKLGEKFWVKDKRDYKYLVCDRKEVNARAKMLIWLIENGYVSFKKES